jgi:hypothetical protein
MSGPDLKEAGEYGMQLSSRFMLQPRLRRSLLVLGVIQAFIGVAAYAQNLDQGKSATQLFADSCVECHRTPRGLARGRYRGALLPFLREHYASSSSTAAQLAAYLASVDGPQDRRSQPVAGKPPHPKKPRSSVHQPVRSKRSK